jgi:integrase
LSFAGFCAIFVNARCHEGTRGDHRFASPWFPQGHDSDLGKHGETTHIPTITLRTANHQLPPGEAEVFLWDSNLTGFGLRLRRGSGGKIIRNWVIGYRAHGKQRRMIVGSAEVLSPAQAREQARKDLASVALGEDPQAEKAGRRGRDELTFRNVAQQFVDTKGGVKPRSIWLLKTYLLNGPYLRPLHTVAVDKVSRGEISARLLAVQKANGAPTAVAVRSAVNNLFVWAMQMGYVDANPCIGAFQPQRAEPRSRVLTDLELATIWNGVRENEFGRIIRLLVLTGARRQEVGSMRWSELDLDGGTWTLPKERSKNRREHTLPITPMMRSILETVPQRVGHEYLFGLKAGFTNWSLYKRVLDERLGLPSWGLHDIRRTVATRMADIGIAPHIIEEILNHRSGHRRGVAGTYNRSVYANEVRAAMLMWSDHVRALVEGGEAKIVALRG